MASEKGYVAKFNLSNNSPVNKYDLVSLEQQTARLTEEHMLLVFQAFKELIPHLGIYTLIFEKLYADLIVAVYSDEFTGLTEDVKDYVQRKPYFLLVNQDRDKKDKFIQKLTDQLETVKKSLFDKHKQLSEALESNSSKDKQIDVLTAANAALQQKIDEQANEIFELEKHLENVKDSAKYAEHQLACDIADLRDALEDAKNENNNLYIFKKSYDDVYFAFMDKTDSLADQSKKKNPSVISTKRANLENETISAQKLEEQMMIILNTMIEDFDKSIEAHQISVLEKYNHDAKTEIEQDLRELEFDELNQELKSLQATFQNSVQNILTELGLLQQHSGMLNEHLQLLGEIKPLLIQKKHDQGESVLSAGLELDETLERQTDPFIAQEQIFSKYSAMMYTSNNQGKSFEEFKDAKFCASCGEKTLLCPHKLSGPEKIYILPHHCSHLKITRPKVRINIQDSKKDVKTIDSLDLLQYKNTSSQNQTESSTPNTDFSRESSLMGMGDMQIVYSNQKLWEDYSKRTKNERKIPRFLTLDQIIAVVEHFLSYMIWTDDYLTESDDNDDSILDMLYKFMHSRYLIEEVANMAAYDFLSAVQHYSGIDKFIQLFGHVLTGYLDAACLRYILLICDFIAVVEWREVEDFRTFAAAIYPFLNDDDFENVQMSYISFSENKISKQLVASFIINLVIKYREPRFHDLENKLVQYQGQENGYLTETEFKEAMDNIVPLCNEQARNRLYNQAEKTALLDHKKKSVPIMKLAQIAAFLALQQISTVVKENAYQKVKQRQEHVRNVQTDLQIMRHDQEKGKSERLMTMTYIKQLSANIHRQSKYQEEDGSYD